MRSHFRWSLVLFLTIASAAVAAQGRRAEPQQADRGVGVVPGAQLRRVALVVGNNSYATAPLQNAVPDARAMAAALRDLGFTVSLVENASRSALASAVSNLDATLRPEDIALFFYAGHGMQLGGENYLVPVDFTPTSSTSARLGAVSASEIQIALSKAKVSLILLDACRNNPFSGERGSTGLAPMEVRGSLVAFATGAGQTASDNPGAANGLFTQELLRTLKEPNLTARELLYQARQRVYDATNGRQFPAVYDGLLGDLVLKAAPVDKPPAAVTGVGDTGAAELNLRAELTLWDEIKTSTSPALFQDYLRQYPQGRFRAVAEDRVRTLSSQPAAVTPVSPRQANTETGKLPDPTGAAWQGRIVSTKNGEAKVSVHFNANGSLTWDNTALSGDRYDIYEGNHQATWRIVVDQLLIYVNDLDHAGGIAVNCAFQGILKSGDVTLKPLRGACGRDSLVFQVP